MGKNLGGTYGAEVYSCAVDKFGNIYAAGDSAILLQLQLISILALLSTIIIVMVHLTLNWSSTILSETINGEGLGEVLTMTMALPFQ